MRGKCSLQSLENYVFSVRLIIQYTIFFRMQFAKLLYLVTKLRSVKVISQLRDVLQVRK